MRDLPMATLQHLSRAARRYLSERFNPQYLKLSDMSLLGDEVSAVFQGLRAKLDSGEIADNGVVFHSECLKAIEQLQTPQGSSAAALSPPRVHVRHRRPLRSPLSEGVGMKSFNTLGTSPAGLPVAADDLLEFHAARLLLLFKFCGKTARNNGLPRIDGLTKMAKLDFFVRYPQFFNTACQTLGLASESATQSVESSMIRFHYGPWDERYYHILAYLEGKRLLSVTKDNQAFTLSLTEEGKQIADQFAKDESFAHWSNRCGR